MLDLQYQNISNVTDVTIMPVITEMRITGFITLRRFTMVTTDIWTLKLALRYWDAKLGAPGQSQKESDNVVKMVVDIQMQLEKVAA